MGGQVLVSPVFKKLAVDLVLNDVSMVGHVDAANHAKDTGTRDIKRG